jgi:Protein of unknown function (DUF3016)
LCYGAERFSAFTLVKNSRRFPLLLVLAIVGTLSGALPAGAFDGKGLRVDVVFFEPKHFTDIADSYPDGTEAGREATLTELRRLLVRCAGRHVEAGQKLTITITDVNLAGEFESWRGGGWADVRIVKDIYPPSVELAFQLKDAEGNIIKSGKRSLRDMMFLMKLSINDRDPLRHEKALLEDWVDNEFREPKKK